MCSIKTSLEAQLLHPARYTWLSSIWKPKDWLTFLCWTVGKSSWPWETGLLFSYFMRIQPSLPLSTHPTHFATPQPKDQRQFPKEGEPERHSQPVSAEVKEIRKLENSKTASVCMEDPQLSSCRYSYNTGKHTPILPNTCALTYHIAPSRKGTLTNWEVPSPLWVFADSPAVLLSRVLC